MALTDEQIQALIEQEREFLAKEYQDKYGKPVSNDLLDFLKHPNDYSTDVSYLDSLAEDNVMKKYGIQSERAPNIAPSLKEYLGDQNKYQGFSYDTNDPKDTPQDLDYYEQGLFRNSIEKNMSHAKQGDQGAYQTAPPLSTSQIALKEQGALGNMSEDDDLARERLATKAGYTPGRPYTIRVDRTVFNGKPAVSIRQVYK